MDGWSLENLPSPNDLSVDTRAVVIALLAIHQEMKLTRILQEPAAEINRMNLDAVAQMKAGGGLLVPVGAMPPGGPNGPKF